MRKAELAVKLVKCAAAASAVPVAAFCAFTVAREHRAEEQQRCAEVVTAFHAALAAGNAEQASQWSTIAAQVGCLRWLR